MSKLISKCPVCGQALAIKVLQCTGCGLELKNDFEMSPFDRLDPAQSEFLMEFLRCRGNLSVLQETLCITYPVARNRLSELLVSLDLTPNEKNAISEELNLNNWNTNENSTKASEIVKTKLKAAGGRATVHSVSGKPYEIIACPDGRTFSTKALPLYPKFTYEVFDVIVDLLLSQNGKARKGLGRNAKLGEPDCELTTVVGTIGKNYLGKQEGESVLDPVFVLAAILEWAGIVNNERGYLSLTADYRSRL